MGEAAVLGHLDIVKHYTENLQNVNPWENDGNTTLHLAAKNGHLDVVKHLCDLLEDKNPS